MQDATLLGHAFRAEELRVELLESDEFLLDRATLGLRLLVN